MNDYILAIEGEPTIDKRLIQPGALTWETPMPVFDKGTEDDPFDRDVIGTITSIDRWTGEGGRSLIRARISWFGDAPTGTGLCAQVTNMEADYEVTADHSLILKGGRIRGAFIGTPAWPDCAL